METLTTLALDAAVPSPSPCCICMEVDAFNSLLVTCEDCGLRVHIKCYGVSVSNIDAKTWRCQPCEYMQQTPRPPLAPHCAVCPIVGGPLRLTNQKDVWAHVLCINWVPELFHNLTGAMDEVVDISLLDRSRSTLRCTLCGLRGGCIQCVSGRCAKAFHTVCAFRAPSTLVFTGYNSDNQQVYHCKTHLSDVTTKRYEMVENSWRQRADVMKYIEDHPEAHGRCRFCGGNSKVSPAARNAHETTCLLGWMARKDAEKRRKEVAASGVTPTPISYRGGNQRSPSKNGKNRSRKKAGDGSAANGTKNGKYKRNKTPMRECPDCGESIRETLMMGHQKNSCPKSRYASKNRMISPRPFGSGGVQEVAEDLSDVLFASWPGQNSGAPMDSTYFWNLMETYFFSSKVLEKKRAEQLFKSLCGVKLEDLVKSTRRRHLQPTDIHCRDTFRLERNPEGPNPPLSLQKITHRCDFLMRSSHCRCLSDSLSQPMIEITSTAAPSEPVTTTSTEQIYTTVPEDAQTDIRVLFKSGNNAAADCKYSMRVARNGATTNHTSADDGAFFSSFNHDAMSTVIGFEMQTNKVPLAQDDQLLISLDMCDQIEPSLADLQFTVDTGNAPGVILPVDEFTPAINLLMEHLKDTMEQNRYRLRNVIKKLQAKETKEKQVQVTAQTTEMYYKEFSSWKRLCTSLMTGYKIESRDEPDREMEEQESGSTEDEDDSLDDGTCVVCFDGQSPETNPIIFCDRCELAVHQRCYGMAKVPSSEFICDRCRAAREGIDPATDVFCQLCSLGDGAFKRTVDGKWVHIVCALWCPKVWIGNLYDLSEISLVGNNNQVRFVDTVSEVKARIAQASNSQQATQKPVDNAVHPEAPALELGSLCVHCRVACGRTIQCCHARCTTSFHPLCAWYEGLPMTASLGDKGYMYAGGGAGLKFQMLCASHLPDNYPASEQLAQRRRRAHFRIDSFFVIRNKFSFSKGGKREEDSGSSLLSGSIVQAVMSAESKIMAAEKDPRAMDWTDMTVCSACFEYCAPIVEELTDVNLLHRRQFMIRCQYCNVYIHPECCISDIGSSTSIFRSNWICERCTQTGGKEMPQCVVCAKTTDYLMPCIDPSATSQPATSRPPAMQALPGSTAVTNAIRAAPGGGQQLWLERYQDTQRRQQNSTAQSHQKNQPPLHVNNGASTAPVPNKWIHVYCSKWQKAKTVKRHHMLCAYYNATRKADGTCDLCFKKGGMLANCAQCSHRFHPICAAKKKLYCARSNRTDWKFYCEAHPPIDAAFDEDRQTWITQEIMSQLLDLRRSLERGRMLLEMTRQRDRQHKRLLNLCKLPLMEASIDVVLKKRPTAQMKEVYHDLTGEKLSDVPRPRPPSPGVASSKTRPRSSPRTSRSSRSGSKRGAAEATAPERSSKRLRTDSGDSDVAVTRNLRRSSRRKSLQFNEEASGDDEPMEDGDADVMMVAQMEFWENLPVPKKPDDFDPIVEEHCSSLLEQD